MNVLYAVSLKSGLRLEALPPMDKNKPSAEEYADKSRQDESIYSISYSLPYIDIYFGDESRLQLTTLYSLRL